MKSKLFLLPLIFVLILVNVFALGAEISPHNPLDDDNLLCSVPGAESNSVFTYEWRKNDEVFRSNKITVDDAGSHFPESITAPADKITCIVYLFQSLIGIDEVVVSEGQHQNQAPVANAGPDKTVNEGDIVNFEGSLSSDSDGTIVKYHWDFGDRASDGNKVTSHIYNSPGLYVATLTVTDNEGAESSDVTLVTVKAVPGAQFIISELKSFDNAFKHESSDHYRGMDMFVSFKLKDRNGNAVLGQTNNLRLNLENLRTGRSMPLVPYNGHLPGFALIRAEHGEACLTILPGRCTRFNTGTYYYTTIVPFPDDFLGKNNINVNIGRSHAEKELLILNNKPIANAGQNRLVPLNDVVNFDAFGSVDVEDLRNLRYEWEFGDGSHASGVKVNHIFTARGVYPVTLKVIDSENDFGVSRVLINVGPGTKQLPIADFKFSNAFVAEETLFDGSLSRDPDGRIVKYEWNFGDNNKALGQKVSHVYNKPGLYFVVLTVTDNDNLRDRFIALVEVKYDYRLDPEDRPGMVVNSHEDNDKFGSNAIVNTRDFHEFSVSGAVPMEYKNSYTPGEVVRLLLNLRNTGNMPENLNIKLTVAEFGSMANSQTSSVRVSAGSNLMHNLMFNIPTNAKKGDYITKIEVDNRMGDRKETYWKFTIA